MIRAAGKGLSGPILPALRRDRPGTASIRAKKKGLRLLASP